MFNAELEFRRYLIQLIVAYLLKQGGAKFLTTDTVTRTPYGQLVKKRDGTLLFTPKQANLVPSNETFVLEVKGNSWAVGDSGRTKTRTITPSRGGGAFPVPTPYQPALTPRVGTYPYLMREKPDMKDQAFPALPFADFYGEGTDYALEEPYRSYLKSRDFREDGEPTSYDDQTTYYAARGAEAAKRPQPYQTALINGEMVTFSSIVRAIGALVYLDELPEGESVSFSGGLSIGPMTSIIPAGEGVGATISGHRENYAYAASLERVNLTTGQVDFPSSFGCYEMADTLQCHYVFSGPQELNIQPIAEWTTGFGEEDTGEYPPFLERTRGTDSRYRYLEGNYEYQGVAGVKRYLAHTDGVLERRYDLGISVSIGYTWRVEIFDEFNGSWSPASIYHGFSGDSGFSPQYGGGASVFLDNGGHATVYREGSGIETETRTRNLGEVGGVYRYAKNYYQESLSLQGDFGEPVQVTSDTTDVFGAYSLADFSFGKALPNGVVWGQAQLPPDSPSVYITNELKEIYERVMPRIYEAETDKLNNPFALCKPSSWYGLEFTAQWYVCDAVKVTVTEDGQPVEKTLAAVIYIPADAYEPPPPDRDGDGIPDDEDPYPDDPLNGEGDSDGDGIPDKDDPYPDDPGNGNPPPPPPPPDRDNDGVPDADDPFPDDPTRDGVYTGQPGDNDPDPNAPPDPGTTDPPPGSRNYGDNFYSTSGDADGGDWAQELGSGKWLSPTLALNQRATIRKRFTGPGTVRFTSDTFFDTGNASFGSSAIPLDGSGPSDFTPNREGGTGERNEVLTLYGSGVHEVAWYYTQKNADTASTDSTRFYNISFTPDDDGGGFGGGGFGGGGLMFRSQLLQRQMTQQVQPPVFRVAVSLGGVAVGEWSLWDFFPGVDPADPKLSFLDGASWPDPDYVPVMPHYDFLAPGYPLKDDVLNLAPFRARLKMRGDKGPPGCPIILALESYPSYE